MLLPGAHQARVDQKKVIEYLLNREHPDGQSKAEFFQRFGFRSESWQVLAEALRNHAVEHAVSKTVESAYGTRYLVEGPLPTPDGRRPNVRTVWVVEKGTSIPRLVTAYRL